MFRQYILFAFVLPCSSCHPGLTTTEGSGGGAWGSGGAGGGDAGPACEPIACHAIDTTTNTTASIAAVCSKGDAAGACVSSDWEYCKCGGLPGAGLFFEPPPSSGLPLERVTLIAPKSGEIYALGIDDGQYCPGFPSNGCDLAGDCALGLPEMRIYQWGAVGNLFDQPGEHTVQIYRNDGGDAPCFPDTTLWLSVPFVRP